MACCEVGVRAVRGFLAWRACDLGSAEVGMDSGMGSDIFGKENLWRGGDAGRG